jgi:hypothetical protein
MVVIEVAQRNTEMERIGSRTVQESIAKQEQNGQLLCEFVKLDCADTKTSDIRKIELGDWQVSWPSGA